MGESWGRWHTSSCFIRIRTEMMTCSTSAASTTSSAKTPWLDVAPTTSPTLSQTVNFRLVVAYLHFPIQVCFSRRSSISARTAPSLVPQVHYPHRPIGKVRMGVVTQ